MILYGVIVLIAGVAMLVLSILLCLGRINLLHDYHQNNVKEENKKKFALSMGISLMIGSMGMISSGLISIIVNNESIFLVSILLLLIPLLISIILLFIFIKKYNGQIFG